MAAVSQGDLDRRGGLRRMRLVATSLLVLAAVVFLLTLDRGGFWGYVHAAAEAAMVGAIADWFAVTALFRHPLGIPIPHTALVPRRKDALAASLEEFVAEHFLTPQALRERYLDAEVVRHVGEWLVDPVHAERVVAEAAPLVARGVDRIGPEEAREFIAESLLPRLRAEPVSPVAGHLLEAVVTDRAHPGLVDLAARELHTWVRTHRREIEDIVTSRAPWWSPQWVDDRVVGKVYAELLAWSREVADDSEHRVRRALDSYLADLAQDLQHDPATMARAEALKVRLLEHPQLPVSAAAVWEAVKRAVLAALDDAHGQLRGRLAQEVSTFGQRLGDEPALRARLDAWTADAVVALVERYGAEVTSVITATISRWDGKLAADRIELHVGRDLQFIRINGTVVGALVGLVLHTVTQLLSG
ncbi:MAG: DUF445 domain-containing protein [Ornithinimicrobium sp.]|uniref:DUF445 domain-containing protein n=1 Tax=Ornithinimicrobium sp. TaxID=1977084 RepID=UPI003D9AFFA2